MSRSRFLIFSAALSVFWVATAAAQASHRPLPIDAIIDFTSLAHWGIGSLSPDGRWFVYAPREGARLRRSGTGSGENYLPTGLSPDYAAVTNLWLVDTGTGGG